MTPYYEDGAVTIYHGEALSVLASLPSESVGALLTDPGRKAIGIEIEERYCEIAARRLSQEVLELGA
jgi:site-specific DNA-methyltransferase (adenine-specific)